MQNFLYLIRHAHIDTLQETYGIKEKIMVGQTDLPLSQKGQEQAKALQKKFRTVHIEALWVSPLLRCVESAEAILKGQINPCIPKINPAFKEISLGDWEGKSKSWLQDHDTENWYQRGENFDSFAPPHGESFSDLEKRVLPAFLTTIQEAKQYNNSIIIAHQAVNRVIIAHLLDIPLKEIQSIEMDYGQVFLLDITGDTPKIILKEESPLIVSIQ